MGFKECLDSLKLSSEEAIIDGQNDSLSDLKKYLHVERTVEHDLSKKILQTEKATTAQLILILGNVGDGKSHLLAKMWQKHPSEMANLKVYNDATESTSKNKTYLDNLLDIFAPYSDINLENSTNALKTIIAINLGTITNFLEGVGDGFSKLRTFVECNHLLDEIDSPSHQHDWNNFHSLNLTDYHIFSLEPSGAKCQILLDILKKITQQVEGNPFYMFYRQYYDTHPYPDNCPIKYNYDMLALESVQLCLSELLVKVVISDKLIVSVRQLMNWIYDLIVPPEFSNLSEEEVLNRTRLPFDSSSFYKNTLPVLLFDNSGTSQLLKYINQYDPTCENEGQDEVVIKLATITDVQDYFLTYNLLNENDSLYRAIDGLSREERISLFLRLHHILRINDKLTSCSSLLEDYINNLYSFNLGKMSELIPLYKQVKNAIYQWNGSTKSGSEYIKLNIGGKDGAYNVTQKLLLEFEPMTLQKASGTVLEKFRKTLIVSFKVQASLKVFNLEIDYRLYQLLININRGYRPNRIDKNVQVKFSQFVNDLIKYQSNTNTLLIKQFNGESQNTFRLSYLTAFDNFEFIEIE